MKQAQKVEVLEMQRTSNLVVEYDVPTAAVEDMAKRFAPLEITDTASYKAVTSAIAEVRTLRITVEKKRVELKRDALEYGRKVDSEAKRITAMLAPIENELIGKKQAEDNRKEMIRQEKIRIEQKRVDGIRQKIATIQNSSFGLSLMGMDTAQLSDLAMEIGEIEIDEKEYAEFTAEAQQAKADAIDSVMAAFDARQKFDAEEAVRKAENERLEKVRLEQEAEAKRLADIQSKLEAEQKAEQDRAEAERHKIQAERDEFEAEKKAEQDRKDREALEKRLKEEARVNAEREAKEKAQREEVERAAREKAVAEEEARRKRLLPDKEKLNEFAYSLLDITGPKVKDMGIKELVEDVVDNIHEVARRLVHKANAL
jgi:hypothetical protein